MRETIDRYPRLPDGDYSFEVEGVPEKIFTQTGKPKRVWILNHAGGTSKIHLFPNAYTPIVLALGGTQVGSKVDWEENDVAGKKFSCSLKTVKSGEYENYVFENCKALTDDGAPF